MLKTILQQFNCWKTVTKRKWK